MSTKVARTLQAGALIPACPLALTPDRRLDERRQRALFRYYLDAGATGLAVGVHTTQFAVHNPKLGMLRPLLQLATEEMDRSALAASLVRVAGIHGPTRQALAEARQAAELGFAAGLVNLNALTGEPESALVRHCAEVGEYLPVFGFYLQAAAGGPKLSYRFWRDLADLPALAAIKVAPFNRYETLTVIRAISEAGRDDVALYTGNDDHIVEDLLEMFDFGGFERQIVGGLLGHWAVWTSAAARLLAEVKRARETGIVPLELLRAAPQVTDMNSAVFDTANGFRGCIAGVHEVLRRQGLLADLTFLDPAEGLSPGQAEELDRVTGAYPRLTDDDFVSARLDRWLS